MQSEDKSDGATTRPPTWRPIPNLRDGDADAHADDSGTGALLHYTSARNQPDGRAHRRLPGEGRQRPHLLGKALGWFSIALGLAQLLAPRSVARASGLNNVSPLLIRAIGVRELASGIGLLRQETPPAWRWSRVAGDVIDLSLLGVAMASPRHERTRLATTAALVAGVAAIDYIASKQLAPRKLSELPTAGESGLALQKSVIVNRSAEDCYQAWRTLENLPRFMPGLQSVQVLDARRSRWHSAEGVWTGELTHEEPGKRLDWRAEENHDETGALEFSPAPGGRGTVVTLHLHMRPPAGKVGAAVGQLFSEGPAYKLEMTLRRFKQWMETGEVATTEGQPSGKRSLKTRLLHKTVKTANGADTSSSRTSSGDRS